jgi:NitT/TauT family transport system substrate-binding protein
MRLVRLNCLLWFALLIAAGCGREQSAANAPLAKPQIRKVVFQSDWFPQAEHGGFYQALAKGFYRSAGLDVEIRSGGPGVGIKVPVATGDVDFGMNRSDDVMMVVSRGLPLVMVAAVLQHDAQALMVHESSPVKSFKDLKGRTVTANLGMTWIPYLQKKYGITFELRPNTYSLAGFLADQSTIQQCFVTNEPYYAQEQGARVRSLLLAATGYDVYHAIICRRDLVRHSPDVVRAFVTASIFGWRDYLENDPTPAHQLILSRNVQMTPERLAYSRGELMLRGLVTGDRQLGEDIGQLSLRRLAEQLDVLLELKVMDTPIAISSVATRDFLPVVPQ